MALIPSPHTVQVRSRIPVEADPLGNSGYEWAAPRPWRVRSIDPGQSAEPYLPNRDLSRVEYAIHADKTAEVPVAEDQVLVDGDWFEVDGPPADWTRGPWPNPAAGVLVLLKAVEG